MTRRTRRGVAVGDLVALVAILAVYLLIAAALFSVFAEPVDRRIPGDLPAEHIDWAGMTWPTTTTTSTTVPPPVAPSAAPQPEPPARDEAPQAHEDASPPLGQGMAARLSRIRACESGGNYAYDDGTYTGAYNYLDSTWRAAGGSTARAADASPAEQDRVTADYIAAGNIDKWPVCGRR